jgi:hypothetical protein
MYVVTHVIDINTWSVDMNKQLKNLIFVLITVLLLAACGQVEATSAPELIATENPTDTPEPVVVDTIENAPTAVPSNESASGNFSQYIGLSYPPFPAGLSQDLSMLIQNTDNYGLSLVSGGTYKMLWLSKITRYDTTSGNPYWEVKDVLNLSNVKGVLIPDGCSLNGKIDNEILIVGNNGKIILAWRANTSTDKFEVLATDGIQCNSDKGTRLD